MQARVPNLRSTSRVLSAMLLAATLQTTTAAHAGPQQSVYLPDPTPRPPDLQRQYADDPAERARQEQAVKLLNKMRMQEVTSATNTMMVLAQELKQQLNARATGSSMTAEMVKAEQIESLAKKVKEALRSH